MSEFTLGMAIRGARVNRIRAPILMKWGQAVMDLEAENAALKAKLEAYDHLLDCKLAWAWDMEQDGGSPIEVAAYMIRTIQDMRAAAQEEKE
mgnify:CR=1 FL=1